MEGQLLERVLGHVLEPIMGTRERVLEFVGQLLIMGCIMGNTELEQFKGAKQEN